MLIHLINVEREEKGEAELESFKAQTFITNPQAYEVMFADTKEKIEQDLEWVHPDEDELNQMIESMKESGS